ncbi:hypothetical protein AXX17_ATUG01870 [Arabidopsis thaliana]|uniref:Uncharacterized protein n=1 Tax=Arabidopsis thaliana TaxID=3702 RepID=A0A178U665_ARATH|nr:hypothetical protein AXX17_ATUG01870 [Arabidopsis thaliana]
MQTESIDHFEDAVATSSFAVGMSDSTCPRIYTVGERSQGKEMVNQDENIEEPAASASKLTNPYLSASKLTNQLLQLGDHFMRILRSVLDIASVWILDEISEAFSISPRCGFLTRSPRRFVVRFGITHRCLPRR